VNKICSKVAYAGTLTVLTSIGLGIVIIPAQPARSGTADKTLANLQAAYDGESNAHARYLAFAEKADTEGYGQVGSLFRAAARAEQIHLTHHAAVIHQMGAAPHVVIEMPVMKSTRENLEASANKGEAYERDTMYPGFIKQAQAEDNGAAVQTFEFARKAEAQHFRLFTEALNNLDAMKDKGHTYYVCTLCGYTSGEAPSGDCVSCSSPREKYEAVN
jgi:rubrerythrin